MPDAVAPRPSPAELFRTSVARADTAADTRALGTPHPVAGAGPFTAPDAVAQPGQLFFSSDQMAALEHLGELLVPRIGDRPGSKETNAPKFLEFLISKSPQDRQTLYKNGLDQLNSEATRLHRKAFATLNAEEAKPILKPRRIW